MKLLEICLQLPDVDVSEFRMFTSKWISYVKSSTNSRSISETDWNQFFSQTNPVAGIDRGAMQDRMKLKDGYRETNERSSFLSNWNETILPIIKEIINPDSENRIDKIKNVRDTIRNIIVQGGGRNTKTAINRMLITFCPDLLIRIPNEDNTKEFIELLKPFFGLEETLSKEEDWIDNSFHIMEFLKKQLGETIHRRTLWDLYTHLKNSDYKSNMNKEKGNTDILDKYVSLLETNKNLILTGAPGTGKTYMAREIAKALILKDTRQYTNIDKQLYPIRFEEANSKINQIVDKFCCMVQFHPSYDYSDFVEGLRPVMKLDNQIGFKRVNGVFKDFCIDSFEHVFVTRKCGTGLYDVMVSELHDIYCEGYKEAIKKILYQDGVFITNYAYNFSLEDICTVFHSHDEIDAYAIKFDETQWVDAPSESFQLFEYLMKSDINLFRKDHPSQEDIEKAINNHVVNVWEAKIKNYDIAKVAKSYMHLFSWVINYAESHYDLKYLPTVFIIDEINRGEISKIFGELFFSIDSGYRGVKGRVCTRYQNMIEEGDVFKEGFYVPENVYIIGTMNDIDRSVESMDFAMRRRFTWKEITPADTAYMLDKLDCATEAKATMERLNKVIEETDGLGAAYMIGPAYFLKLGENGGDFNKLWEMNIEPLLREYLRGFRKTKEILYKFSKAYYNQIDED